MLETDEIILSIIITLFAFGLGYLLSILNDWQNKRKRKSISLDSIIVELEDLIKYVESQDKPIVSMIEGQGEVHPPQFQIAAFESLLYSGTFNELDTKIQIKISQIYEEIKATNTLGLKVIEAIVLADPIHQKEYGQRLNDIGSTIQTRLNQHRIQAKEIIPILKASKPKTWKLSENKKNQISDDTKKKQ